MNEFFLAASGVVDEIPGPYELQGSILIAVLFFGIMGMFITKRYFVRTIAAVVCFLSGISGGIVYYINQTSVGNTMSWGVFAIQIIGGLVGAVLAVIWTKAERERKKISETAKLNGQLDKKRRFDD